MLHWKTARAIWYALMGLLILGFIWSDQLRLSRNVVLALFVGTVLTGLLVFFGLGQHVYFTNITLP